MINGKISVIGIGNVEQGSFQEIQFIIPQWAKKLVNFWFENSIADEEFFNAIEYVLQIQIMGISKY